MDSDSKNYKYHTVTLDTVGQTSSNTFTCYLAQPIRNIVEAKLISAHIKTTEVTEHCYISIEELDSHFMERTSNIYEGQSGMTQIRNSFASLISESISLNPSGNDSVIIYKGQYPVETKYTSPIGSIDRFRVKIWDQYGNTIRNPVITNGHNFIVIRLKCEVNTQSVAVMEPPVEKIKELRTLLECREIDKETFEDIKQKLLDDYLK